jgi:uncharacterized protein YdeI (YjbR/CyaY-like superfamily)
MNDRKSNHAKLREAVMSEKARSLAIALAIALSVLFGMPLLTNGAFIATAAVAAQDDWKTEFEDVCSKTQDSMSLSPDELKGLVDRCDALKPRIEKLDETEKKVYLKRLQMCRDLLAFVMQSKIAAVAVAAQDDWKKEFEDICSQTEDSMSLSPDELKGLVDRCEALKPRIEKLDETQRKVYLKRLQMCRDHLVFVIESKPGK